MIYTYAVKRTKTPSCLTKHYLRMILIYFLFTEIPILSTRATRAEWLTQKDKVRENLWQHQGIAVVQHHIFPQDKKSPRNFPGKFWCTFGPFTALGGL